MPHVVTENCYSCRFTDCVSRCPVKCFHIDTLRVYIDPDVCVDCGACIPACPVKAIYDVIDMPEDKEHWISKNAVRSKALPFVTEKQNPLGTAVSRRTELGF